MNDIHKNYYSIYLHMGFKLTIDNEKPEGKRPLVRPRRRWEDNLRWDLWEIGDEGDWILLAQDRVRWRALVNSVMNLRVRQAI
jgi:hypothetical protein